jgi:hypothetical protein
MRSVPRVLHAICSLVSMFVGGFGMFGTVLVCFHEDGLVYSYVLHIAYTLLYTGLRFDVVASC